MNKTNIHVVPWIFLISILSCCTPESKKTILTIHSDRKQIKDSLTEFSSLEDAIIASQRFDSVEIQVTSGIHYLNKTIYLDSQNNNLLITAAGNERPVIYGGKAITGWKQEGKFWVADVGNLDFRILEVNGQLAERSRLPEKGTYKHLSEFKNKWLSTAEGGFSPKPTERELMTMKYNPDDIESINDLINTEITLFHMWDETLVRVDTVISEDMEITFTIPAAYPAGAFGFKDYIIWNSKHGMKKPGQWYLDRNKGKVYYWPREGQTLENTNFIIPVLDELIRIENASNITIKNLEFRSNNAPVMVGGFGAKWFSGAVYAEKSNSLKFDNLTFSNLNTSGIKTILCNNVQIENCHLHNLGAAGIRCIGSNAQIKNNLIHDVGQIYPSTIALYVNVTDPNAREEWEMGKNEGNVIIEHNTIYNTPYVGIASGGHDTKILHNRVYDVMQVLSDGSGIYVTFCKNLLLKGNFVSDIGKKHGAGTSAYYLDEFTDNATVEGNLSLNVNRPVHTHFCKNNVINNNIFIIENGEGRITHPRCENITFKNNILVAEKGIDIEGVNLITSGASNILYSKTGKEIRGSNMMIKERINWTPIKDGELFKLVDPQIESYKNGIVTFSQTTPAKELGIKPIDVSSAGVINDN